MNIDLPIAGHRLRSKSGSLHTLYLVDAKGNRRGEVQWGGFDLPSGRRSQLNIYQLHLLDGREVKAFSERTFRKRVSRLLRGKD